MKLYGADFEPFPWEPMMFWEDITYILVKIGELFKKLFGLDEEADS